MIRGLGLDLCEITRMEKMLVNGRFLERYFNEEEADYIRSKGKGAAQTMAGIFAAKEAFAKAMGTGIAFDLREIGVVHNTDGMPGYALTGNAGIAGNGDRFWLSITHDGGTAAAVCIREFRE